MGGKNKSKELMIDVQEPSAPQPMLYSFRAECEKDVGAWSGAMRSLGLDVDRVRIARDHFVPDVEVEFYSTSALREIQSIFPAAAKACLDLHVIAETLRPLSAKDNSMDRQPMSDIAKAYDALFLARKERAEIENVSLGAPALHGKFRI